MAVIKLFHSEGIILSHVSNFDDAVHEINCSDINSSAYLRALTANLLRTV